MSDNPSTPVTATDKKTYPSDPVPADYASRPNEDKLRWLDSQGFARDPTINLGDCYRFGAKLARIFRVITGLLTQVYSSLREKASETVRKTFSTFLKAYNESIGRLSNDIYTNVAALLDRGRFINESNFIEPVSIPDLPIDDDENTPKLVPKTRILKDEFWGFFLNVFELLLNKWNWLSEIRPGMNLSYNHLIKGMVGAGETFFLVYQKEQDGSA